MATDSEVLGQFLETIKSEIVGRIPKVSGKTANSFSIELGRDYGILYGPAYLQALEDGRGPTKPGSKKGSPTLQEKILEWLTLKGVSPTPKDNGKTPTLKSLSFAIATKIHREGNKLYRSGGKSGVLSNILTEGRIATLLGTFGTQYRTRISGTLDGYIRNGLLDNK